MKHKPWKIGALEAIGVAFYILVFAFTIEKFRLFTTGFAPTPMAATIIFLLAFATSALICGLIVFGYPYLLFMDGKKTEAVSIVIWGAASLAIISAVCAIVLLVL